MSNQPINRNYIPLSKRTEAALAVVAELEKKGLSPLSISFAFDHVTVYLRYAPNSKVLDGNDVRVTGGPDGLFQVRQKIIGMVRVEWVVPYVHLYVPENRRLH